MLTEAEARKRWCPFGGDPDPLIQTDQQGNIIHEVHRKSRACCIASACMAWRWRDGVVDPYTPTDSGFCGLAGKP